MRILDGNTSVQGMQDPRCQPRNNCNITDKRNNGHCEVIKHHNTYLPKLTLAKSTGTMRTLRTCTWILVCWFCSLSGISAFVTSPFSRFQSSKTSVSSVSSFSSSRLLLHTLHPEIPSPINDNFAKDIETVVKKIRPWSTDPTMRGKSKESYDYVTYEH